MRDYYVTLQITQEVTDLVTAFSAETAIEMSRAYFEGKYSPVGSRDIQVIKCEVAE